MDKNWFSAKDIWCGVEDKGFWPVNFGGAESPFSPDGETFTGGSSNL